jgi:hypothetical protein
LRGHAGGVQFFCFGEKKGFFGFFLGVVFFQYPFPISGLEFPVRKLAEGNLNSL